MSLTAAQLQARNGYVGASEVASVMGIDGAYEPAWNVWARKTGKVEPETNGSSEAADLGNELEPLIRKRCSLALKRPVVECPETFRHHNGVMAANLDAMVDEAKLGSENAELKSSLLTGQWGEPGTDDIPKRVLVQVTAQMACAKSPVTHVAYAPTAYGLRGFRVQLYHVKFNPDLAEIIEEAVCRFWRENVQKDIPPEGSVGTPDIFRRIRRAPGKTVALDDGLVRAAIESRDARLAAEKRDKEIQSALKTQMKDAEFGECSFGLVEMRAIAVKGYAVEPRTDRRLVLPKGKS